LWMLFRMDWYPVANTMTWRTKKRRWIISLIQWWKECQERYIETKQKYKNGLSAWISSPSSNRSPCSVNLVTSWPCFNLIFLEAISCEQPTSVISKVSPQRRFSVISHIHCLSVFIFLSS
jgi:hypothetical protein